MLTPINIDLLGTLNPVYPDEEMEGYYEAGECFYIISNPIKIKLLKNIELTFSIYNKITEASIEDVNKAVHNFLSLNNEMYNKAKKEIFKECEDCRADYEEYDFEDPKDFKKLTSFTEENIWSGVSPTELIIEEEAGNIYIHLLAECFWEEEHGLRLKFKNGSHLTNVGIQD